MANPTVKIVVKQDGTKVYEECWLEKIVIDRNRIVTKVEERPLRPQTGTEHAEVPLGDDGMPVRMCQTFKTYQPVKRENKKYRCNLYEAVPDTGWGWYIGVGLVVVGVVALIVVTGGAATGVAFVAAGALTKGATLTLAASGVLVSAGGIVLAETDEDVEDFKKGATLGSGMEFWEIGAFSDDGPEETLPAGAPHPCP